MKAQPSLCLPTRLRRTLVRWASSPSRTVAALVVFIAMLRLGNRITLTTVALALIFGGALGNVHDRIVYGSVVDFIEVHIFAYHWPDFNVADSSIVTGACLLFLDSLLPASKIVSPEATGEHARAHAAAARL